MLKNSTYGESSGSHCFQEAYPVGRRESVKHWFFKERQRPPANPPVTSQSRSGCPVALPKVSSQPEKDSFSPILPPAQKKQRPRGAFMRLTGTLQNVGFKGLAPFTARPWAMGAAPEGLSLPGKSLRLTPSQRQRGFSCPTRWIPSPPSAPPAHGCGAPSAPSAAPWCGFSHCPGRRCR